MNDTTTIIIRSSGAILLGSSTQIVSTGSMGPAGPAGPPGSPGASGDANYQHDQISSSLTWVIPHTFGWRPNIQVFDTSGEEMFGYIRTDSVDLNTTTLTWEVLISGRALAS